MLKSFYYIEFTIVYLNEEYKIKTYSSEFTDLGELICRKLNLEAFGQCGGLGHCATCMHGENFFKR